MLSSYDCYLILNLTTLSPLPLPIGYMDSKCTQDGHRIQPGLLAGPMPTIMWPISAWPAVLRSYFGGFIIETRRCSPRCDFKETNLDPT